MRKTCDCMGSDLFDGGVLTDAADEDFLGADAAAAAGPAAVGAGQCALALVFGRGVFRVDLLAVERVRRHGQHAVHAARIGERDEAETATPLQQHRKYRYVNNRRRKSRFYKVTSTSLNMSIVPALALKPLNSVVAKHCFHNNAHAVKIDSF